MTCDHCASEVPEFSCVCPVCEADLDFWLQILQQNLDPMKALQMVVGQVEDLLDRGSAAAAARVCERLSLPGAPLPYMFVDTIRLLRLRCQESLGDIDEAIAAAEAIQPGGMCGNWNSTVLFDKHVRLARLYRRKGDREKQLEHLDAALAEKDFILGGDVLDFFCERAMALLEDWSRPGVRHREKARDAFREIVRECSKWSGFPAALRRVASHAASCGAGARDLLAGIDPTGLEICAIAIDLRPADHAVLLAQHCRASPLTEPLLRHAGRLAGAENWVEVQLWHATATPGPERDRLTLLLLAGGVGSVRKEVLDFVASANPLRHHVPRTIPCEECRLILLMAAEELLRARASAEEWEEVARLTTAHPAHQLRIDLLRLLSRSTGIVPESRLLDLLISHCLSHDPALRHAATELIEPFRALDRAAARAERLAALDQALEAETGEALSRARNATERCAWSEAIDAVAEARSVPRQERSAAALSLQTELGLRLARGRLLGGWIERRIETGADAVTALAAFPDGTCAVTAGGDSVLRVWDLTTGGPVQALSEPGPIVGLALASQARLAFTAGSDEMLRLWDLSAGRCVKTLKARGSPIHAVAVTADGRIGVTAAMDRRVCVWDLSRGKCVRSFDGLPSSAQAVAVTPDGRLVVSGHVNGDVTAWDTGGDRCLREWTGQQGPVTSVAVSPDARLAAAAFEERDVRCWETATGNPSWRRSVATTPGTLALATDDRTAICGTWGGAISVQVSEHSSYGKSLPGEEGLTHRVALAQEGRMLISAGSGPALAVWRLDWEVRPRESAPWDEAARPFLEVFLCCRTPVLRDGLTRRGRATWTAAEFDGLYRQLQWAGYGWLHKNGVRARLDEMARAWEGPLPFPAVEP